MTDTAKLIAPPHLHGPVLGSGLDVIRRRQDRHEFVRQAAAAGHSITAVAAALGVTRAGFARDFRSLSAIIPSDSSKNSRLGKDGAPFCDPKRDPIQPLSERPNRRGELPVAVVICDRTGRCSVTRVA